MGCLLQTAIERLRAAAREGAGPIAGSNEEDEGACPRAVAILDRATREGSLAKGEAGEMTFTTATDSTGRERGLAK